MHADKSTVAFSFALTKSIIISSGLLTSNIILQNFAPEMLCYAKQIGSKICKGSVPLSQYFDGNWNNALVVYWGRTLWVVSGIGVHRQIQLDRMETRQWRWYWNRRRVVVSKSMWMTLFDILQHSRLQFSLTLCYYYRNLTVLLKNAGKTSFPPLHCYFTLHWRITASYPAFCPQHPSYPS